MSRTKEEYAAQIYAAEEHLVGDKLIIVIMMPNCLELL